MTITALSHSVKSATSRIGRRQGLHLTAGDRDIAVPGTDSPRDAASRGLAATGGRVAQAARSAFQRFRRPFSPCQEAMALLPQFGPFPNYCLVSVCWMLIWKAENFDWKRSSPMGDSKIDSTTCATSPTTKTVAGCEPATCRAISPASRTSPSPSFASRGASTPSPKPTGTTLGGPRTPCASSSTRPNAEPHATATPRRLAPPPRQRSRSPGRAIRASGLLCIPLQTTQIPSSVTSPSSHSTGYRTTTTDSNQSRAHPCTEQNFTLNRSRELNRRWKCRPHGRRRQPLSLQPCRFRSSGLGRGTNRAQTRYSRCHRSAR